MYISIWLCEPGSFRLQGIVINNYVFKKQHVPASFISEIVKFQSLRISSKSATISPPMGDARTLTLQTLGRLHRFWGERILHDSWSA
jgi:hypothetical protein